MVADTLEWILCHYFDITDCFHYLDDSPQQVLGPATILTILGIELDTNLMHPEEKLEALLEELSQFSRLDAAHHTCTKRQLLSLIGKLAFACKVIPAGRIFLRRLIDTAYSVDGLEMHIPLQMIL